MTSSPDYLPAAPGTPPAPPLPELILAGLAIAAITLRDIGWCDDCGGRLCPDHQRDEDTARQFDAAYMQVATGSAQWFDLAVTLAAGMN